MRTHLLVSGIAWAALPHAQVFEGPSRLIAGGVTHKRRFQFRSPQDCEVLRTERGQEELVVQLDHDLPEGTCITINIRSAKEQVWYYIVPPAAGYDTRLQVCVDAELQLRGAVELPRGYSRLSAWWVQPEDDTEPITAHAHAAVAVLPPEDSHGGLAEAVRRAAAENDAEVMPQRQVHGELKLAYQEFVRHPALQGADVLGLLEPAVAAALREGTPRSLWGVLTAAGTLPGGSLPERCGVTRRANAEVFRMPVLSAVGRRQLLEELLSAKRSPLASRLSLPNNNEGPRARYDTRWRTAGIVLDEIGLDGIASSLARDVLLPFARLLHPEWGVDSMDSYHAFSIHEQASEQPAQRPLWEGSRSDSWTRIAAKHNDVCEVSMNICLGSNFSGGGVYFLDQAGPPQHWQPMLAEHVPGMAFINLCQHYHGTYPIESGERHALVIRLLSSKFRRAPAETFATQCLNDPFR